MLRSIAHRYPSKKAILSEEGSFSYSDILGRTDALARALELLGLEKGDKVAFICPNGTEFVTALYAVSRVGGVIVPINTLLKNEEYRYILDDCGAKIIITGEKLDREVRDLVERVSSVERMIWIDHTPVTDANHLVFEELISTHPQDEDNPPAPFELDELAAIFYTSGTTGHPKGAMISNRNLFSNLIAGSERFDLNDKDRFIVYLPMFHSFTFTIMILLPFFSAGSIVVLKSLFPFTNVLKQALLKRVTIFMGVPDIYNTLIRTKLPWYFRWFHSIRCFISGGSALSEDTLNKFKKVFKHSKMLEGYGLSECSPAVAINPIEKQKSLSVGLPLDGYAVKVVNEEMIELPVGETGELIVKGDCVMMGYLNNPCATEETIQNGWLRTGDIAKLDEEGYIYIVDRIKDLIISKGINIYPRQIEEQMMLLPSVKLAAVIAQKDLNSGEVPIAFIELEEGYESTTPVMIKGQLKEHLANFKIPKTITVVESLPKTATGKVLKRVLKQGNH
ncbi:MAG: long-chain-fatty-acid--CoA ligase [Sulfuricurvum sp.]|jgi:long-chain acyl-CoA synthetase|nr:long-chain-fatty-acid--CoA ligase [Sulfuricurvum sp.]